MSEPDRMHADLIIDPQVTREHEQPLVDVLTDLGFTSSIRELPPRRVVEPLTWLVLIALPLQAFLNALGSKAAEGAYHGLKEAIRNLRRRSVTPPEVAPSEQPRPVLLQDPATSLRIILEHDLPSDAYQQLAALDLTGYRLGPLHYDHAQGRWRSELDEANQP